MQILITYHDEKVIAMVLGDYKVSISSKDAGLADRVHEIAIELDQCRECGVWCSEDDEMYGEYCGGCSEICMGCMEDFNKNDMQILDDEPFCSVCLSLILNT